MQITTHKCTLFDLESGAIFSLESANVFYMACGKSEDGKRSFVRLSDGEIGVMRASEPVRPCPNAELIIRKV